ncbi:hypothetical protein CES85_1350 [Ochrobactrum quorumnocens]|uniref:Uncharacterized protein n=1 Tax=Ochrobactrum quorumnocens TaxID=271865 RepID=A0A248UJV9_9HYPH|nr:hypothetical protein CES85_1350 [[Ochrobactrum] quorumnocens]
MNYDRLSGRHDRKIKMLLERIPKRAKRSSEKLRVKTNN